MGYEPRFVSREELYRGDYLDLKALILPRNERLYDGDLAFMYTNVVGSGVHL